MGWVHNASPEVNAQSQWPLILCICLSLTTLMTLTVFLRTYVRACMIRSIGIDDYVMVFSMICSIAYNGLCVVQSRYGLGLPIILRPAANLNTYSVINFSGRPFYMAGIAGFKVALCFAYLRITGNRIKSRYRNVIRAFMVFTILSHLGGTLVLMFQCTPIHKSWLPKTPGKCLPNDITFYVLAAITIFCDIIIFLMPIPLLVKAQINLRRKIGLIGIFTLGLFTTVCSVMRMVQIITIAKNGNSTMLVLWGAIEMNVGIFLTCLPSLTPLFTFFAQKAKSSHYGIHNRSPRNPNTDGSRQSNPLKLSKMSQSQHSLFSDTTAVQRSGSEDEILPMSKALMLCTDGDSGGERVGGRKASRSTSTLKATEIEVCEDEQEGDSDGEGRRVSQRGW